jgi:DNA-binding protein HU-beta
MSKEMLVKKVAGKIGGTQVEAEKYVTAVLESIPALLRENIEETGADGKLVLMGFGTFNSRFKEESMGRNPKTGEEVAIPAGYRTTVTIGKKFKQIVSGEVVVDTEVEEVVVEKTVAKAPAAKATTTAKAPAKPVAKTVAKPVAKTVAKPVAKKK